MMDMHSFLALILYIRFFYSLLLPHEIFYTRSIENMSIMSIILEKMM